MLWERRVSFFEKVVLDGVVDLNQIVALNEGSWWLMRMFLGQVTYASYTNQYRRDCTCFSLLCFFAQFQTMEADCLRACALHFLHPYENRQWFPLSEETPNEKSTLFTRTCLAISCICMNEQDVFCLFGVLQAALYRV